MRLYQAEATSRGFDFIPRASIAPRQEVATVRHQTDITTRELALMRWGLIPPAASNMDIGAKAIVAPAETLTNSSLLGDALNSRRCLVIADGYYEWRKLPKGPKQPYFISLTDGRPFAFAGLWERWERKADNRIVDSCVIVTTAANDAVRRIRDRMPVILMPNEFDIWLDVHPNSFGRARAILKPPPAEKMAVTPISTRPPARRQLAGRE